MADDPAKDDVTFEIKFRGDSLIGEHREENIESLRIAVQKALNSGATLLEAFRPQNMEDRTLDVAPPNRKR